MSGKFIITLLTGDFDFVLEVIMDMFEKKARISARCQINENLNSVFMEMQKS